jgi:hypothetical protein
MATVLCSDCKTRIRNDWKHCSQCGQEIERIQIIGDELKRTSFGAFFTAILIGVLAIAPLVNIFSESDGDLLSRLKNRGVLSWIEDKSSEEVISAGEYTPDQALMTATGSCRIWIYKNLKDADDARDNYINDNVMFSASWSGVDEATNTGVVLLTLEPKSYCSEEAASFLNWTLE